ncbi:MAG: hypothetical protein RJB66_165 [Pseudomonadota bacterium]|jgi:phosphate/sulfate permease
MKAKKFKWKWIIIPTMGFAFGMFVIHITREKFARENALKNSPEKNWSQLLDQTLSNQNKVRTAVEQSQARGIASESQTINFTNGKSRFVLKGNEIINIEKDKNKPEQPRLAVANISTGKKAFISGEIILETQEISRLPNDFDGTTLSVSRELGNNKYIVTVNPPTDVPKAVDKLRAEMAIESLKVDVVDREIQPR